MTPQEDDVLLVLLVQSGDTAAFEKLLRRLHAPMRKYVTNLAGESSADDILQDVSWQIFRQIRQLREPKVLRAWAFRIDRVPRCLLPHGEPKGAPDVHRGRGGGHGADRRAVNNANRSGFDPGARRQTRSGVDAEILCSD